MTSTTTAPLTRRQAREIERLTGERPVAGAQEPEAGASQTVTPAPEAEAPALSRRALRAREAARAEQALADEVRERIRRAAEAARVRAQQEQERPAEEPTEAEPAGSAEPEIPAAFVARVEPTQPASEVRSLSVRAPRPLSLVRARRRRIGGVAAVAGTALLATAATVTPLLGEPTVQNPAAADLTAGGASGDTVAESPQAGQAAAQTQSGAVSYRPAVTAPEELPDGYQVTSFDAGAVESAASASPSPAPASAPAQQEQSAAPVVQASYVSPFPGGVYSEGYGTRGGAHNGIDVVSGGGGTCGSELVAVTSGVVTFAGYQGGYGNHVEMRLEDGTTISYSHIQDGGIRVAVGQQLNPGDLVGLVGTTGNSTGCHLHFEVKQNGSFVNPTTWLAQYGIAF
ncbi:MAG: M23 family metallopeptidase [Pseudoclavibacter sp.]|nr:M23 family metallopeptidase [Pseudoclavibacter sp.]